MNTSTPKPALTIGRIVAPRRDRAARARSRLPPLRHRRRPRSPCRPAAHAGQLVLQPCHYATENGSYAADCGTLVVPENRADPRSRLIALPVTRIRARSANPGARSSGSRAAPASRTWSSRRRAGSPAITTSCCVGYRGIDGSVRLDCPEVVSALKHSTDFLSREVAPRRTPTASGPARTGCRRDGVDLAGYTLPERADDLEAARVALGYERIDLLSESAGTRTAMIYAWRHPKSVHRSVMLAVNPPGHFLYDAKTTDAQIGRYSELCAQDGSCSARTNDLAASMRRTSADMPDHFAFLPIDKGNVKLTSFFGLMESTVGGRAALGPRTIAAWLSAAKGDASGFWLQSLAARLLFPKSFVWGDVASSLAGRRRRGAALLRVGPASSRLDPRQRRHGVRLGRRPHARRVARERERQRVQPGANVAASPTLLIGGDARLRDAAAERHAGSCSRTCRTATRSCCRSSGTRRFWNYEPKASTRLVNTFFDTGRSTTRSTPRRGRLHARGHAHARSRRASPATMVGLALIVPLRCC